MIWDRLNRWANTALGYAANYCLLALIIISYSAS